MLIGDDNFGVVNNITMPTKLECFRNLHQSSELLLLPNAWNAKSAKVIEEQQFPTVATSSAAVAESLGYADGEGMPFSDYLFVIRRILSAIDIPLSVDMEMGYGYTPEEIFLNFMLLAELGVVGVNLEDSVMVKGQRTMGEADVFAERLYFLKKALHAESLDLFLNVRCDTYLLDVPQKEAETHRRIKIYEHAGADGLFLPCISKEEDIASAVEATSLPINVMSLPALPSLDALRKIGVRRVSMGPFLFTKIYRDLTYILDEVRATRTVMATFL
jgi:2-methylisocitrate lyase-like PEP mutase family enzyme